MTWWSQGAGCTLEKPENIGMAKTVYDRDDCIGTIFNKYLTFTCSKSVEIFQVDIFCKIVFIQVKRKLRIFVYNWSIIDTLFLTKLIPNWHKLNLFVIKCGSLVVIWCTLYALKLFFSEKLSESLTGIETVTFWSPVRCSMWVHVAQWLEHLTGDQRDTGSIPVRDSESISKQNS